MPLKLTQAESDRVFTRGGGIVMKLAPLALLFSAPNRVTDGGISGVEP